MTELIGNWHKIRMRCDYCGNANPNGHTFIINSDEISGRFCSDHHAKAALEEMRKARGINQEEDENL